MPREVSRLVKYEVWRLREASGLVKYEVWRSRKAFGVVKCEFWRPERVLGSSKLRELCDRRLALLRKNAKLPDS